MKQRHLLLTAAVALAAWLAIFGDKTPNDNVSLPVTRASSQGSSALKPEASLTKAVRDYSAGNTPNSSKTPTILALRSRESLIGEMDSKEQNSALFSSQSWTPAPPPPKPADPIVPTAPPLPFKYMGKRDDEGQWQVFLTRDTTTFVIKKDDVIENQYKVLDITPSSMTLLYLPLNQPQSLAIE